MSDLIEITLVLRPPTASGAISQRLLSGHYDPAEVKRSDLAADPADIEAVTSFAAAHHLDVRKIDAAARSIHLAGLTPDIEKAIDIPAGGLDGLHYRGAVNLREPLKHIVIAVLGLDETPVARHHTGD